MRFSVTENIKVIFDYTSKHFLSPPIFFSSRDTTPPGGALLLSKFVPRVRLIQPDAEECRYRFGSIVLITVTVRPHGSGAVYAEDLV